MVEALWRHAAIEELSVLWEVGRDGDEHSQGLAERQQAVRTDLLSCLSQLLGLLVWLFLSQERREPQGAARVPKLSTAWGVCNSALGASPGSWTAAVRTAVAPPGKGGL